VRALDTNLLVRVITQDDVEQSTLARAFVQDELSEANPGYVSLVVICELVWTLKRLYGFSAEQIRATVMQMLQTTQLQVEGELALKAALISKADLIDALVHELGRRAGCTETVTFDRRFARLPGVRLLS
jgi:predicted nucleic-acid-binding protein